MADETNAGTKIAITAAIITAVGAIMAAIITILPDVLPRPQPTPTPVPTRAPLITEPTATLTPVPMVTLQPTPTLTITPTPTLDPAKCNCSEDLYNCGDFASRGDAQICFDRCLQESGEDIHRLDNDKDGTACESYSYAEQP